MEEDKSLFEVLDVDLDTPIGNLKSKIEGIIKTHENNHSDARKYKTWSASLEDQSKVQQFLQQQKDLFRKQRDSQINYVKKYALFYMLYPGLIEDNALSRLFSRNSLCLKDENGNNINNIDNGLKLNLLRQILDNHPIETFKRDSQVQIQIFLEVAEFEKIQKLLDRWNSLSGNKYNSIINWYNDYKIQKSTANSDKATCFNDLKSKYETNIKNRTGLYQKYLAFLPCLDIVRNLIGERARSFITKEQIEILTAICNNHQIKQEDTDFWINQYLNHFQVKRQEYSTNLDSFARTINKVTAVSEKTGTQIIWQCTLDKAPSYLRFHVVRNRSSQKERTIVESTNLTCIHDANGLDSGFIFTYAVYVRVGTCLSNYCAVTEPIMICSPVREDDFEVKLTTNSFLFLLKNNTLPQGVRHILVKKGGNDNGIVGRLTPNCKSIEDKFLKDGHSYTYSFVAAYQADYCGRLVQKESEAVEYTYIFHAPPAILHTNVNKDEKMICFTVGEKVSDGRSLKVFYKENDSFEYQEGVSLHPKTLDGFNQVMRGEDGKYKYGIPQNFLGFIYFLPITCKNNIFIAGKELLYAFNAVPGDIETKVKQKLSGAEVQVSWRWKPNWNKVVVTSTPLSGKPSSVQVQKPVTEKSFAFDEKVDRCSIRVVVELVSGKQLLQSLPFEKEVALKKAELKWKVCKKLFKIKYELMVICSQPINSDLHLYLKVGSYPNRDIGELVYTLSKDDIPSGMSKFELPDEIQCRIKKTKEKMYFNVRIGDGNTQDVDLNPVTFQEI